MGQDAAAEAPAAGDGSAARSKLVPALAVAVVVVIAFVALMLYSFIKVKQSSLAAGDPNLRDGIRISANVVDVVPADRVVRLRFAFQPVGTLAADGDFLAKPVKLTVLGGADVIHDAYEASQVMLPADVRIPLRSGNISMYPFDSYDSTLRVEVTTPDGVPIPSSMMVVASNPGYSVEMASRDQSSEGEVRDLTIRVKRAPTTIVFALFTSVLMLTLTTLAVLTTFWLLRGGASESVRFVIPLILVLLFAFPAIRSFAPGVPPLGVLIDFLGFFWCEIALGVTVVFVYANLMREMRKKTAEAAADNSAAEEDETEDKAGEDDVGGETTDDAPEADSAAKGKATEPAAKTPKG
jgi:hypothetical protein